MSPRLAADFWVRAYLRRLELAGLPAYVAAHGDAEAGSVVVKLATLDGRARALQRGFDPARGERIWMVLAEGSEADVDAALLRERGRDRDLWIIEVEDRLGRGLLDEPGLGEG